MPETTYVQLRKFGRAVRSARMESGLSQEAFAERTDLHRTYISEIERGMANVTFETMVRITRALQTKPSALFASCGL